MCCADVQRNSSLANRGSIYDNGPVGWRRVQTVRASVATISLSRSSLKQIDLREVGDPTERRRQMDEERLKAEVLSVYSAYMGAFLANDVATLNKLIQYPLTYIGKNHSAMMDTYPAELRATKRWHDTLGMDQEVVF